MTEKMDPRRAKVRLLDLAHDLELADMPTEADALRCMARGPTFSQPATPNVPRNVPNHGPFTISTPYTKVYCNGESTD